MFFGGNFTEQALLHFKKEAQKCTRQYVVLLITKMFNRLLTIFILAVSQNLLLSKAAVENVSVQLFVVLPLSPSLTESATAARWERGLEILPAAHIAVERINQEPTILPGYQLQLVEIDSGTCTDNALKMTDALLNFYNRLTADSTALGVLGLFCTPLTQLISPLAGREEIGLLQISASPSPLLRENLQDYPLLNFAVPSAAAYYNTMFRMIEAFDWSRVYIIAGIPGTHYFHTAESFYNVIASKNSFTARFSYNNPMTIRDLRRSGFRIVFASVDAQQAATLICQVHKEGLTSPLFAWIFYEHSLEDLLAFANETCGVQTMTSALNGSFFLQFPLAQSDPQVTLVSGQTYQEYYSEYLDRLNSASTTQLQPNLYANVLYDQVWAFALALNDSLDILDEQTSSHTERLGVSNHSKLANVINRAITNLSLEGASSNTAPIAILRVGPNGLLALEGDYEQLSGTLNISTAKDAVAKDEILRRYSLNDPLLSVLFFVLIGGATIMTTVVLILFIYYRNEPEIKATSPKLSLFMFLGCYLIYYSIASDTILRTFVVTGDPVILGGVCSSTTWSSTIGATLIYATLFARLLRIYHVFNHFGEIGKLCSDGILVLVVIAIAALAMVILILQAIITPLHLVLVQSFKQPYEEGELPYFEINQICVSKNGIIWVLLSVGRSFLLFFMVAILAIKTRKIRHENFKDTKKVNAYIAYLLLLSCAIYPISLVSRSRTLNSVLYVLSLGSIAVFCQLLLFVPKVVPPFLRALRKNPNAVISKPANMLAKMKTQLSLRQTLSSYV